MRTKLQTAAIFSVAVFLSACQNSSLKKLAASTSNVGQSGASNVVISLVSFKIASVSVGTTSSSSSSSTSSTTGLPLTITFDTNTSASMTSNCTAATGSNPCVCKFVWNEVNTSGGSALTFTHKAYTNVSAVQGAAIQCPTPSIWSSEIADNTSVTISVEPASTNPASFSVSPYTYVKGTSSTGGDFNDSMGRSFVNILRYACYEQRQRGMSLVNKIATQQTSTVPFSYSVGNQFCLLNYEGHVIGGSADSECAKVAPADYSAQSYYYNMYIRDNESGDANAGNAIFVCPKVTEALNQQKDSSGNVITSTQGKFWPMDSSFALSLGKTTDFPVGVVAHTKTTNVGDPTAQSTACDGTTSAPSSANSLLSSCLGFAAKTNLDGTCPKLTVSKVSGSCPTGSVASGSSCVMPTYRLRRFYALYPPIYDTDGKILPESQRIDQVYVLDRPLYDGSGNMMVDANGNPYSMLGPKPCPYSFFDTFDITGDKVGYHGTNDTNWTGKNVDNIFFPYQDSGPASTGTCAATMPKVDYTNGFVTLQTYSTKQYVRPITAWAPHYEEDTGFQACAPQSNPLRDPPLHFAYNGTNMAWCAEAYPTQNDNYTKITTSGATYTKPVNYTSHKVKGVLGGTDCTYSANITGHSSAPTTTDTKTCDRTVVNPSNGIGWAKFPLLAPETDVETALQSDSSFGCTMTYDNNGGKASAGKSPAKCCSNLSLAGSGTAHLEPTAAPTSTPANYTLSCQPPDY